MIRKLLFSAVCALPATGCCAADDVRPNIIFFITDDVYPWQLNFMPEGAGKNFTPNLDRLAREGTIMRGQHVSSSVCTPSRYSCLTGRYASRSLAPRFIEDLERVGQAHVQWNTYVDTDREKTVAHHLREAGYRTGFVGKDHMVWTPDRKPLALSVDPDDPEVRATMANNAAASEAALQAAGFEFAERIYRDNPDFNGSRSLAVHNQDWITEGALKFLQSDDKRPFFLYFATTIPHGPTEGERSWKADRRATPEGWLKEPPQVQPDAASIARRAREHGVVGGETMIWLDDALGALLDTLQARGELEHTVIVFFNDHGETAKGSVYEGGVHDPSVVWRAGGWPVGHECDALVSNIDFAPTILELAGAPPAANMDGKSLLPILTGSCPKVRDTLFFEMGYTRGVLKDGFKYIALRYPPSIANMSREERQARLDEMNNNLRDRGRPVHTEDPMTPFGHLMAVPGGHDAEQGAFKAYPSYFDADQLFNLKADPGEQHNLARDPRFADRLADLKAALQLYLDTLPGEFPL